MSEMSRNLTAIELRNLMLDALAYKEEDIDSQGKTFEMYDYQGHESDLYRLMQGLAVTKGLIKKARELEVPA